MSANHWDDDDVNESADEPDEDTIACPHCGHAVFFDSVQCPHCRMYIEDDAFPDPQPVWRRIVILTALVILVIFIGPFLLMLWVLFWA